MKYDPFVVAGVIKRDVTELRNIFRLKKELEHNQRLTPQELSRMQEHKLRRILAHAVTHAPFYRELYRGIDITSCRLQDLPVIQKRDMMSHYDEFVTDPRLKLEDLQAFLADRSNAAMPFKDDFVILNSSGTSGEKGIMAYHWREFDYAFAAAMARGNRYAANWFSLIKFAFTQRLRVANVMIVDGHSASFICSKRISTNPDNPIMANYFYSVFMPIDKLCEELNAFQPHILQAYSTSIATLAREQLAGRLKLGFDDPRSAIVSFSEPLDERTRELSRKAFGRDIINTYGACESIILARECEAHRGMHINSDLIIYEVVDENYRPVPPGVTGNRVLVTNLYTFSQPMIRYELQDRVRLADFGCTCGNSLPLIASVEGRTEEILWISRPGGGYDPVHPYLFLVTIQNNRGIEEFQVEQIERDRFVFRVVPSKRGGLCPSDLERMMEETAEREGYAGRMQFVGEVVDAIPRDPVSGKILQVKTRLKVPEGVEPCV